MKSILRYLVILLLMTALPLIAYTGISNATTAPYVISTPTGTLTTTLTDIPSFAPLYGPIFGVRIVPGAYPVGAYSININPGYSVPGTVSGHMTLPGGHEPVSGAIVYLGDANGKLIGLHFATTDANGYYDINNLPYGQYHVYYSFNVDMAQNGQGTPAGSAGLTAANPNAVVNILFS